MNEPTSSFDPDSPINVILAEYLDARRNGTAPSREELLARHPEYAAELASFLDGQAALDRVAPPPRSPGETETFNHAERTVAVPGESVRYFGDYELLSEIARGGMGVVFRARQVSLNRVVALKMILSGHLATATDLTRFRAEAEAAANLDHPNIVPIYEIGEHQGQHYFSMKLVDGGSLAQRLVGSPRPAIRDLIVALTVVARAVHYAHQRGIMHRDLKPANILIDSLGQPHITDFGLAKHVTGDSHITVSGSIVGTPSYMPPEQAMGSKGLTVAADVYSLGAILYELLVARPPFKGEGILETLRLVREQEPARPRSINPAVDRDLETIALKCLEKDPARRYESAAALADDLARWLEGVPIAARPSTSAERAWKWARRRPAIAGLLAAVAASLVVGSVVSTGFALDAGEQARLAREAESEARSKAEAEAAAHARTEEARAQEADARQKEVIARGKEVTAREAAELAAKKEAEARAQETIARRQAVDERNAKDREFVRADGLRLAAEADAARFRDPGLALLLATEGAKRTPNHLTFASLYSALAECREERTFFSNSGHGFDGPDRGWYVYEGETRFARYLPGGKRILTAAGNSLRVWDIENGKQVTQWKGFNMPIRGIALSPDGQRVAVTTSGYAAMQHSDGVFYNYTDRVVYVVDLARGVDVLRLRGSKYALAGVEFSADGKRILAASWDGHARVYDAITGALVQDIKAAENALLSAHFTPDGKKVLTTVSNVSRSSHGYDAEISTGAGKPPTDPPFDAEAKPLGQSGHGEGSFSGLGGVNAIAHLWDIDTGKSVAAFQKLPPGLLNLGHIWYPKEVVLSPDGNFTAIAFPEEITIWETATGTTHRTLKGHEGEVVALAFRPGGKQLASAGKDKTIRLWDVATGREVLRLRGHSEPPAGLQFSASGRKLVSWSSDRTVRVWDAESGAELFALRGHTGAIRDAEIHSDELRVVSAGDNSIRVWTLEPTKMPDLKLNGHAGKVTAIAYSPDGKFFLTSSTDQSARLWDTATGQVVREFGDGRPLGEVRSARFSPDGTRIVTAAANRSARAGEKTVESAVMVWDVASGRQILSLDDLPTGATHAEFTPDGARILTIGDGALRIQYTTQNQDPKNPPKKLDLGGFSFNVDSSGTTQSGIQHLWDAKTGKLVATLFKGKEGNWTMGGERTTFAFTPDGSHLLTVNKTDQMPTLYRMSDGKEVRTFRATSQWGGPAAIGMSPDGKTALVEKQGQITLYDPSTGLVIAAFKDFPGRIADFTWSNDGKRLAVASYKAAFIFEMPDRKLVATLKGHLAEVTKVAFSPDGSRVLTGAADDTAAVWETATGKMLSVCKGHSGTLTSVLFRADGQQVATLGAEGSARLWPVDLWPGVAARTPRTITSVEAERFEVAVAGQPKQVDWRDRIPQTDPPPGTPPREIFTRAHESTPEEVLKARRADLTALRALPTGTSAEIDTARAKAHEFRRTHPGTVEAASAGELLTRLASPLAALDSKAIPAEERGDKLPKEVVAVLGESRQRDDGSVGSVSISPAGKLVATRSGYDSQTLLWDAETLDRRGSIAGQFQGFIPGREELYTYSRNDGGVVRWDVSGPAPRRIRQAKLPAAGLVFCVSRDGKFAAGCGQSFDDFRLWDLTAGEHAGKRLHKATTQYNEYKEAIFSPAGDKLAMQVGGAVYVYDVRDPAKPPAQLSKTEKGNYYGEFKLSFSLDGTRLAARMNDTIVLWDVTAAPPKEVAKLTRKDSYVTDYEFAGDGASLFALYSGKDGLVWDLRATPPVEKTAFTKPISAANSFARSRDGQRLYAAIGTSIRGFDRIAEGWNERRPLVGPSHCITSLAFASDGRRLYAAEDSEGARAWSLEGDRFVQRGAIEPGQIGRWVAVSPDDKTLVGGTYGFSLWDAATLTRRTKGALDRRTYSQVRNALSADGKWLARGNWKPAITLFDLSGPEPRQHAVLEKFGNDRSVAALAISPDGRYVVAAPDQTNDAEALFVWRITDKGFQPLALPHITGSQIAFAPDGRTLAVADFHSLTLIDLSQEVPDVKPAIELPRISSRHHELMFTADGTRIVTVRDSSVSLWNASDGKKVGAVELPRAPESVALAPDGRHLAVGNKNGTIWVLRLLQ